MARYNDSGIPEEFKRSKLSEFVTDKPIQKIMLSTVQRYLENYETIKDTNRNSMGMIAEFGEQSIKDLSGKERRDHKREFSSYGIGKTHLQAAAANILMFRKSQSVMFVRDVEIMQKLQSSKYSKDQAIYKNLIEDMTRRDVLIWDDLGKSKASDAKQDIYYEIINQRYVNRLPILFSSNEDEDTLGDRVGYAALDRLLGMSKDYLLLLKGESYRRG